MPYNRLKISFSPAIKNAIKGLKFCIYHAILVTKSYYTRNTPADFVGLVFEILLHTISVLSGVLILLPFKGFVKPIRFPPAGIGLS